ncbi:MAG: hypothetical protein PWP03_825 [Candidatus Woesearchaeota archaeon]|nr:hypothetical protein [Candidatus Woesearchaeota archaeon]
MTSVLNIRLGHECNHLCKFCTVYGTNEATLSTEHVKKIIRETDAHTVVFTGGEPTIRKDFIELVKFAHSLGKNIELQTNVSNITDEIFETLISTNVTQIMASLHSHKREVHKYLSGVDNFDTIIKNLKRLVDARLFVAISHVINELNYKDLLNFVKFILSNVGKVKFYFGFIRPNGRTQQHPELVPRLYKVQYHLYKVLAFLDKHEDIIYEVEGVPLCYMLEFKEYSSEYIRLNTERYHQQEYINSQTGKYNLLKKQFSELKKKSKDCELCVLNNVCPGVWKEYAEMFGLEELYPIFEEPKKRNKVFWWNSK